MSDVKRVVKKERKSNEARCHDVHRQYLNIILGLVAKKGVARLAKSTEESNVKLWKEYKEIVGHARDCELKRIQQSVKTEGQITVNMMPLIEINGKPLEFNVGIV